MIKILLSNLVLDDDDAEDAVDQIQDQADGGVGGGVSAVNLK